MPWQARCLTCMACKRPGVRVPLAPQVKCTKSILCSVSIHQFGSHSATGGLGMVESAPDTSDGACQRPAAAIEYRSQGTICAPMGAFAVKRRGCLTWWPVALGPPGWGDCCCGFSLSLPVCAAAPGPVSSWSARSRAAARTNELDAGKRRPMIGSEEEPSGIWGCRGRAGWVGFPGDVLAGGVVSHAPIRRLPRWRAAMTMTSGTGLLSQVIERGVAGSCGVASSPGLGDPPGW